MLLWPVAAFVALSLWMFPLNGRGTPPVKAPQPKIPQRPLAGGGMIPMMVMGGNDFSEWFKAAGKGAAIQTFYSYGNGRTIAPQLAVVGRENVFVSSGIPCGCCGDDSPRVEPMTSSLAMEYIDEELAQVSKRVSQ